MSKNISVYHAALALALASGFDTPAMGAEYEKNADREFSGPADPRALLGMPRKGVAGVGAANMSAMLRPFAARGSANQRVMASQAARSPAFQALVANQGRGRNPMAPSYGTDEVSQIALGVDSEPQSAGGVPAGNTLAIQTESSVPLAISRLVVASAIAAFFNIDGITIARVNLLAGGSGVPAEAFLPNAISPALETTTLPAGSQIITQVENVDGAPHRFRGVYYGEDLTP